MVKAAFRLALILKDVNINTSNSALVLPSRNWSSWVTVMERSIVCSMKTPSE